MKAGLALVVSLLLATCACTSSSGRSPTKQTATIGAPASAGQKSTPPLPSPTRPAQQAVPPADVLLIAALYRRIDLAFQRSTKDGVRAIIATQYPGDRADVNLTRCMNVLASSSKPSSAITFTPKLTSVAPDPGYLVNSDRVHHLRPRGRIYTTQLTITQGAKSSLHVRHQVITGGAAYQFTAC